MGAGASTTASSFLSTVRLPNQLFVEGGGSVRANGTFVLRTNQNGFPTKIAAKCNQNIWFVKEDDEGCWMGFLGSDSTNDQRIPADERKWMIFTSTEILYIAPITGKEISSPREGRWELGDEGLAPAPTVNLHPLPSSFRLLGWKSPHDILNGEYLPLGDIPKLLNNRPIFKHAPVLGVWTGKDRYRMWWFHGAWRIGYNDQQQPDSVQCMAFAESEATHPTEMNGAVWKATTSGLDCSEDEKDFELVEGVSVTTGTSARIYIATTDGEAVISLTVRPWFDWVKDLQAQVCTADTPSQRQQLFFRGDQLQEDGRVLALHGVIAECTIQLVTLEKKALLDALFDESDTKRALDVVGGPAPGTMMTAYWAGCYNPADGRIYLAPRDATSAVSFDPVTKTWETFGDTFPATTILETEKWTNTSVSSFDRCLYAFPSTMKVIHRMLKIDPINRTAQEIGEDLRPIIGTSMTIAAFASVAGDDGCIYYIPLQANFVLRFDPRTSKITKFGKIKDMASQKNYPPGTLTDESGREFKYWTAALDASGRYICCPPAMASRVLRIDIQELTVEMIGDDFDGTTEGGNWLDLIKYASCALGGDGCLYGIPFASQITRVIRINPTAKTASFFGPGLPNHSMAMWFGACTAIDGCVYATPHSANHMLRVDPFTGTVSKVGQDIPDRLVAKLGQCLTDKDGAVWNMPLNLPSHLVRLAPARPQTSFLTSLLQPEHHIVLCEGLRDLRCYGPALAVALWREAVRVGGDSALVSELLEAAGTALPQVVIASIKEDNGSTASRLLRTILAVIPPQENDYYFNPTRNTWEWHEAEAKKRGMYLASVGSKEEHDMLHRMTYGVEVWIGGCRKSTSQQPPNSLNADMYHGAEDWEWSDGTPFSFATWNSAEPNNGSNNIDGREDRVNMYNNSWHDSFSGKMMPGIYRKPISSPPLNAIQSIVTDRRVLPQCFAASEELRDVLVHVIYRVLSMKKVAIAAEPPANKTLESGPKSRAHHAPSTAIARHLESEWTDLSALVLAAHAAPSLSGNERECFAFLSNFVNASAILEADAANAWQPLPESADDWCWPPAPLVPLRAAAKIVQNLGADAVQAVWDVLAGTITEVLVTLVDAVRSDIVKSTNVLATVFNRERKSSLSTYQKQLRRARRDPTFPEFTSATAELMKKLEKLHRKQLRVQSTSLFHELYSTAEVMKKRLNGFLTAMANKCAHSKPLFAPLKGMGRALEKIVLMPGIAAQAKVMGLQAVDAKYVTDVLRGSLKCPDFTEIVFILDLLEMLDVDMGDPKKAIAQGWDLERYQIRLIHLKDRFNTPTSGGWADTMVNFQFVHGDDTQHVMELQLQHTQMLVVRKEGKLHDQYNKFRSAFELLEAVGKEPHDCFDETNEDLPPLEKLKKQMQQMQQQMQQTQQQMQQQIDCLTSEVSDLKAQVSTRDRIP